MGNSFFQFKQFTVTQDRSAMKVSTDGCVLGASVKLPARGVVLDIGTGTGLVALMIAQRSSSKIDAVEIDQESFLQAGRNIAASPWPERIQLTYGDIREFNPAYRYSLIVCNPPYFEQHLRSPYTSKNQAKHADQLSAVELLKAVTRLLEKPGGNFTVVLPENTSRKFIDLAEKFSLHLHHQLQVRDNPLRPVIRSVCSFSFLANEKLNVELMTIKDGAGNYTNDFTLLLKPFYLNL
jgi:tRNA1Val (adenine37-N6)-methyltransferase